MTSKTLITFLAFLAFLTYVSGELDLNNFRLKESSYNSVISQLDSLLPRRTISDVLESTIYTPLPASDFMTKSPWYLGGWRWAEQNPNSDETDMYWEPQGVTTASDSGYPNDVVDQEAMMVMWNDVRNKSGGATTAGQGVRVSFVRKGTSAGNPVNRGYVHVLLVEPYKDNNGKPNYRPLFNVDSGGIVWRGNWLYVTDSQQALRVFDLNRIWSVSSSGRNPDTVGLNGATYSGGAYPFIIPQARTYTPNFLNGVTFNPVSASLDRSTTNPSLILGESTAAVENATFARFALDTKTNLLSSNNTPSWAYETTIHNVEGAVFAKDSYFLVINGGDKIRSDMFRWTPGSWGIVEDFYYRGALPNGAQGICYKPAGEELWLVGSIPGERYVMAVSQSLKTINTGPVSASVSGPISESISASASESVSASASESVSASASGSPAGKKLGGGAVAGIALGGVLGVGALCGAVLFFLRRRGAGPGERPSRTQTAGAGSGGPELDGEAAPWTSRRAEMGGEQEEPTEMAEGNPRVEMR